MDKIITDHELLSNMIRNSKITGKRIVFAYGAFDIIHAGHIAYLKKAKTYGDILVVGINDDASVKRTKGQRRPIVPLEDRMAVLAALSVIDLITPFSEDAPRELMGLVKPDIFVKADDYETESLPVIPAVKKYGGQTKIIPLKDNRSTTDIINKIIELYRKDTYTAIMNSLEKYSIGM